MEEVYNYLKATETNFLTTRDGDGVSCRPFGYPVKCEGKLYMTTHDGKDVVKQLNANRHICIVAYDSKQDTWMRIFCEAIDDSDNVAPKQAFINEFDWAEEAGYTIDNPAFKSYYLANVKAELRDCEGEVLASYQF